MTSKQFAAALETIGWTQRHLARVLACDTNLPIRWAKGEAVVPESIGRWLNALADAHRVLASPEAWRVRPMPPPPGRAPRARAAGS